MCDIWKSNPNKTTELEPKVYARLPISLKNINISGGEPFLRNDLPEVIEVITKRCKNARLVFSTNGLFTPLMKKLLPDVLKINPNVGIRFSIDGIGDKHQEMRGIPDAFDRVMSSLNVANELGVKDIGFSYTATNTNLDQLLSVYHLTQQKRINFTFCGVAHNSEIEGYFTQGNKEINDLELLGQQLNVLVKKHLQTWNPNLLARAYYEYGIYYRELYKKRPLYCGAGDVLFYMDPFGNIFSCNIANRLMGNILESDFEIIWKSTEANNSRVFAKRCPHQCWMICTVSPYLKKRPFLPLLWVLVNKIKLGLGKKIIKVHGTNTSF